jgi:hypothetical protein
MVRTSEDALAKERAQTQKTTTKKTDDHRTLNDQVKVDLNLRMKIKYLFKVESLKTSERQLKSKLRSLTNEIALLKRR